MNGILVADLYRIIGIAIVLACAATNCVAAQQATSGTFVLHKFAKAMGNETYSIEAKGDTSVLRSHFLFTDRDFQLDVERLSTRLNFYSDVFISSEARSRGAYCVFAGG